MQEPRCDLNVEQVIIKSLPLCPNRPAALNFIALMFSVELVLYKSFLKAHRSAYNALQGCFIIKFM